MPEPDPAVPAPADADVIVPAALRTIRRLQEAAADLRRQLDALEQDAWRPQDSAPPHLATKIVGRVAAAWAAVVSRRVA